VTRRFRDWLSPRDGDDAELDALLAETWEGGAAALAKVLDIEAGKAALLAARARQETAGPSAGQDAALATVREEIDTLLAEVTAELNSGTGPAHAALAAYLLASRTFLIQLRTGLIGRSLTKDQAGRLVGSIEHALDEADRDLRSLPAAAGGPDVPEAGQLRDLVSGIRRRLPALASKIDRLFNEADDTVPRVPVPSP
jgi:hypothetical protein